jgi:hypothetical protein
MQSGKRRFTGNRALLMNVVFDDFGNIPSLVNKESRTMLRHATPIMGPQYYLLSILLIYPYFLLEIWLLSRKNSDIFQIIDSSKSKFQMERDKYVRGFMKQNSGMSYKESTEDNLSDIKNQINHAKNTVNNLKLENTSITNTWARF